MKNIKQIQISARVLLTEVRANQTCLYHRRVLTCHKESSAE